MTRRSPIRLEREVDNADGYQRLPKPAGTIRDFTLQITAIGSNAFDFTLHGPRFPHAAETAARLDLSHHEIFGAVQACRQAWMDAVIDLEETVAGRHGNPRTIAVFQEHWDFAERPPGWRDGIGEKLAEAGKNLWYVIFERPRDRGMRAIGRLLHDASAATPFVATILSDDFFIPWNLLYTAPASGDFDWSGFWGFRHVLEQKLRKGHLDPLIDGTGELHGSFNFDAGLDGKCIDPQKAYFASLDTGAARFRMRTRREELLAALRTIPFDERLTYFCCHGKTSGNAANPNFADAQIALTGGEAITAIDIDRTIGADRALESNPLVFFNACEGGQMTTMFYKSLAAVLLEKGARAILGSQIDVPVTFAPEYARRFFDRFLGRGERETRTLGRVVRDLAQELVLRHNNPLAITYSLYRGIDCAISRAGE